jgi:hypothetical protein
MLRPESALSRCFYTLLVVLLMRAESAAAPAAAATDAINQKKAHEDYNNGDFESVIVALEGFMKRNRTWSHADSVFIAKHLAVVYSANPTTREKGKYYMYKLLELLPSAKLVDMYVSDEIDRIFEKVKEEFLVRRKSLGGDSAQAGISQSAPAGVGREQSPASPPERSGPAPQAARSRHGMKSAYWIAGGTGVVVVGLLGYYLLHDQEVDPDQVFIVK